MSSLFWPGDERAGSALTEAALLRAMVQVESAWLSGLVRAGVAPASAGTSLTDLVTDDDVPTVAEGAESSGNPAVALVALLRERADPAAAQWLHRGLTSQDVLDTALLLGVRQAADAVLVELARQVAALVVLAEKHRATPMIGRTLTQAALPITLGAKASRWLVGVLDAADDLTRVSALLPAQLCGAVGTMAATTELAGGDEDLAVRLVADVAASLGLAGGGPWPISRTPMTSAATAMTGCTAAWGVIANDVLTLSRPETAELSEPLAAGRGGSSTLPQKVNPVLSVLIRRAALAAPSLAGQLLTAAADSHDERPAGAWHTEWEPLALLVRHTVTAASQASELLEGLTVHTGRIAANLAAAEPGAHAEQGVMRALAGATGEPSSYLGASDRIVDRTLQRAHDWLEGRG